MFDRFIVATDLSLASYAVVKCVGGLKSLGAKDCLLLQCVSLMEASSLAWTSGTSTDFLGSQLSEQKRILEEYGFEVTARIVPGSARVEVNRIAEEEDYSLVVVGSRGHSLIGATMLGGVAYSVIQSARRPVLLVRIETKMSQGDVLIHGCPCDFKGNILFPTDFSDNADHAFRYLEQIVAAGGQRVSLFHVQDRTKIDPHLLHRLEEFNAIDRDRLQKMKAALESKGSAHVDTDLAYGTPVQEILRRARETNVDLVVMGSQGRGFIKEIFLGSVSNGIARLSQASVLLVPAMR